jgi:hypothetical protein
MPIPAPIRPAGTLTAILLCAAATSLLAAPALAQDGQAVVNQVQLGDVFSQQTLNVDSASNGATAAATSVGNSATATGSGAALLYQGAQEVNADVQASSAASVGGGGPGVYVTSSATGNTATAGTCCATTSGASVQTIDGYHQVKATSDAEVGAASQVSVDSAAVGNTQGWEPVNGPLVASVAQTHLGTTDAETTASVGAADTAGYSATSVGNNVTVDATNASVDLTASQAAYGYATQAFVTADQGGGGGGDVAAAATASANNINVTSDGGAVNLASDQLSGKPVTAAASLSLGEWSGGATVSAYGVANSALVSNSGAAVGMTAEQTSEGPVIVTATLTGGAGGDGLASATGVGNAVTGSACGACNGVVRANTTQTSSGGVSATSTVNGGALTSATGSASAVGNTASFIVQKPAG